MNKKLVNYLYLVSTSYTYIYCNEDQVIIITVIINLVLLYILSFSLKFALVYWFTLVIFCWGNESVIGKNLHISGGKIRNLTKFGNN